MARNSPSPWTVTFLPEQRRAFNVALDERIPFRKHGGMDGYFAYMYPSTGVPRHIELRYRDQSGALRWSRVVWHNGQRVG